jgi:mannose-6-phosphate isomerase
MMNPLKAGVTGSPEVQGNSGIAPLGPLCFKPYLRPMVWGGRRLAAKLGKTLPTDELYGESWEVSDHPHHPSVVATGPHAGRTLRQLMDHDRASLLGSAAEAHARFPWLIKFLDAHDWLSVQVHPDEVAVRQLWPGEESKTEAWFILDVLPGARIYAGLRPGVDEPALRAALAKGTVAECLHSFEPRAGDCVFLPAGTVHAVGGGVLIAEVQQTSDATYRLFDWDRRDAQGKSRTLHVEESMASTHWDQGPVIPVHADAYGATAEEAPRCRLPLVRSRYFHLDYVSEKESFTCGGTGVLQAALVLAGAGWLQSMDAETALHVGQAWVLPASGPPARIQPVGGLGCLVCSLPG